MVQIIPKWFVWYTTSHTEDKWYEGRFRFNGLLDLVFRCSKGPFPWCSVDINPWSPCLHRFKINVQDDLYGGSKYLRNTKDSFISISSLSCTFLVKAKSQWSLDLPLCALQDTALHVGTPNRSLGPFRFFWVRLPKGNVPTFNYNSLLEILKRH